MKKKYDTLMERVNSLRISPKDAPPPITADRFGKWLRAIRNEEEVEQIPAAIVSLVCDIEILKLKARRSTHGLSAAVLGYAKSIELQEAIESFFGGIPEVLEAPKDTPIDTNHQATSAAVSHDPIPSLLPGTFVVRGGRRVFNLNGEFWTGGDNGEVVIEGGVYEYPEKNFGNFKKRK